MRETRITVLVALAGVLAASLLALGLSLSGAFGSAPDARPSAAASALQVVDGVPVGVLDTPAGALAASDDYVALASQSVEQNPSTFAALVAQAYAPQIRAATLEQARAARAGDAENMSNYAQGGRGLAVIGARRLDSYTAAEATITSWLGGFVWGPQFPPRQSWNLVDTTLVWRAGRWLVASSVADLSPAPVPAVVYVDGRNDTTAAFARLAGMSSPLTTGGG